MSQQLWYLTKNGQQFGPLTQRQLSEMAVSGQLQPGDQLWTEGLPQWIAAETLTWLFPTSRRASAFSSETQTLNTLRAAQPSPQPITSAGEQRVDISPSAAQSPTPAMSDATGERAGSNDPGDAPDDLLGFAAFHHCPNCQENVALDASGR
jgi:hypothetical protein